MLLDVVNALPEFLQDSYFEEYSYSLANMEFINNRQAYLVDFEPVSKRSTAKYIGRMYFDAESMALVAAEFSVADYKLKDESKNMVTKLSRHTRAETKNASYHVNYINRNGTYTLQHVRLNAAFKVFYKTKAFPANFNTVCELAITDLNEDAEKLRVKEHIPINHIFFDQAFGYDPQYWGSLNIIKPDEKLQDAMQKTMK
ncbi:MAG: hypothetical protein HC896_05655 [Bacteroidales bacterium]|nr:hypothetical protein [Bacteroidales bacterium]